MTQTSLILGQTLTFVADPFHVPIEQAADYQSQGAVAVRDGLIIATGTADKLRRDYPKATLHDYGDGLITAGFVDAHAHYPQTAIIASWGARLIEWLNKYTFPEEMRFGDPDYAANCAKTYFDLTLANGTTSVCSFCTIHPESVDAFFS
ncbi:MAG: amidohydrolase family protein, partial [Paracoccaceae bacterium]